MSTKPFSRIFWIVLDGMGYEHARLLRESGGFPGLSRLAEEGYLGSSAPSSPGCQTPSALLALFAGAGPSESGVWGFRMPDPAFPHATISGFSAQPRGVRTIWAELEERGERYALMNVAFRNDPLWAGRAHQLDFGLDGYRLWRRPGIFRLDAGGQEIEYGGLGLRVIRARGGATLRKGSRTLARLAVGQGQDVNLSGGARVFAYLLDASNLVLIPFTPAVIRGTQAIHQIPGDFLDAEVFRVTRAVNERRDGGSPISVAAEMKPCELSMTRKSDCMIEAIRAAPSRLVVGYFPLIDEFNHVYVHQLERDWPGGRVSQLFCACMALVDQLLLRLMAEADPDTLVVVSSDHGAVSYRRMLYLNELFAAEGLVRRMARGYDLARSTAYYHPSDCGLVVMHGSADRASALAAVRRILERARRGLAAQIDAQVSGLEDPYLAFLFPLGDTYFTGEPPRRGRAAIDEGRRGGHHLSPLTPSPWIQAVLGVWSPRSRSLSRELSGMPVDNREVKGFLLRMMGAT